MSGLEGKSAVIGVVGPGYVGLPLILRYNQLGYHVVGLDIDEAKINKLNKEQAYIEHVFPVMREHNFYMDSIALTDKVIDEFDAAVLATDHDAFGYQLLHSEADVLVDVCGKFQTELSNIAKA